MKRAVVVALLLTGVATGVQAQEDLVIPPNWQGIWDFDNTTAECVTGNNPMMSSNTDTLCFDDPFGLPVDDPGVDLTCTGTVGDVDTDVTCTASVPISPGCTQDVEIHFVANVQQGAFTATTTTDITFTGLCGPAPDTCLETTTTAVRTGNGVVACGFVPVESVSWGTVKSRF